MTRHGNTIGESERWLSVIVGGMLALSSLRRRDVGSGILFALGSAFFLFRGITGHDGLVAAVMARLPGAGDEGSDENAGNPSEAGG